MVTQNPTKLPLSARARTVLLWLLTAALVYAQMIGAMHGVVHAHLLQTAAAAPDQQTRTAAGFSGAAVGWQALPFSGHEDSSTCRVFDSLGYGDAVAVMPVSHMPFALPCFLSRVHASAYRFRWPSPFDARGPPVAR